MSDCQKIGDCFENHETLLVVCHGVSDCRRLHWLHSGLGSTGFNRYHADVDLEQQHDCVGRIGGRGRRNHTDCHGEGRGRSGIARAGELLRCLLGFLCRYPFVRDVAARPVWPWIGSAVFRLHPGIGSHSYKAVFAGTPNGVPAYASSSSSAVALTVTGTFLTRTSLAASGNAGNYSLTSHVTGLVNASGVAAPSGMVSFLDTSSGNLSLASAALGAATEDFSFQSSGNYTTGIFPNSVAVGDFNGDGISDLATVNSGSNAVTVLLAMEMGVSHRWPIARQPGTILLWRPLATSTGTANSIWP